MFYFDEIFLPDAEATVAAGRDLGRRLAAARSSGTLPRAFLLTLSGDLGAGKTTFCQGLGLGLAVDEPAEIVSPTFTLANEYHGPTDMFHLDLYRLESAAEFLESGLDEYLTRPGLAVVEWPEKIPLTCRPAEALDISLTFQGCGRLARRRPL